MNAISKRFLLGSQTRIPEKHVDRIIFRQTAEYWLRRYELAGTSSGHMCTNQFKYMQYFLQFPIFYCFLYTETYFLNHTNNPAMVVFFPLYEVLLPEAFL